MTHTRNHPRWGAIVSAVIAAVCTALVAGLLIYDAVCVRAPAVQSGTAMGTVVTAKVWGPSGDQTARAVLDRLAALDKNCLSAYEGDSDIARINQNAGSSVKVSSYTAELLSHLIQAASQTDGAFDPTVGALVQLWDIGGPDERIPSASEIDGARGSVDWRQVQVHSDSVQIRKGQSLDTGAAGKGAACDEIRELLQTQNAESAVISVGGSILLYGKNPEGDPWSVGIRDPRGESSDRLGTLELGADLCISTSGDYERYFERDGIRYCHILDPRTGCPARSGLISVTVVSSSGVISDVLSTACFVLGYERSLPVLESFDNAQAVFVTDSREVYVTPGLADHFTLAAAGYTMGASS